MNDTGPDTPLRAEKLALGYGGNTVVHGLDLAIAAGSFTVLVGPNACGKSTALHGLARLLRPLSGGVLLNGRDIHTRPTKEVARELGLLPQSPVAPQSVSVVDLVARGRAPHQSLLRQFSREDEAAVTEAMALTGVEHLRDRPVESLSGGQRQRVWIALALAQRTPVLLLDEPTTFLDMAHQVEVLDLCADLHRAGRTLVAVLHDLNQAARYATHIVAMREGSVVTAGPPDEVITAEMVREVFGLDSVVVPDPETGTPLVIPRRPRGARRPTDALVDEPTR
ncbi:ABC transporter ATP-binding protein [Pseudonocardia sp. NPDC049635]|uniref:ABC transporter ATP-binding protein n=1 Tax=Pseudonocardia sp. NPDC049635 TaxID=3155506 RepID=UPI00340A1450